MFCVFFSPFSPPPQDTGKDTTADTQHLIGELLFLFVLLFTKGILTV